jgi:hypothetical protein
MSLASFLDYDYQPVTPESCQATADEQSPFDIFFGVCILLGIVLAGLPQVRLFQKHLPSTI